MINFTSLLELHCNPVIREHTSLPCGGDNVAYHPITAKICQERQPMGSHDFSDNITRGI